jgi:hypothetical protein
MPAQMEPFVKVKWDMLKLIAMMDRKKVWRQYDCFKELLYYSLVESTENCKVINYDAIKTINMIDYYRFRWLSNVCNIVLSTHLYLGYRPEFDETGLPNNFCAFLPL